MRRTNQNQPQPNLRWPCSNHPPCKLHLPLNLQRRCMSVHCTGHPQEQALSPPLVTPPILSQLSFYPLITLPSSGWWEELLSSVSWTINHNHSTVFCVLYLLWQLHIIKALSSSCLLKVVQTLIWFGRLYHRSYQYWLCFSIPLNMAFASISNASKLSNHTTEFDCTCMLFSGSPEHWWCDAYSRHYAWL